MYLQTIALVCLSIVQPFFCYGATNTDGDVIFEYLGIDSKTVLNHKLTAVDVPTIHKRDLRQGIAIKFQAIDEDISLWLRPRDSILASDETPVYYAHYAPGYPSGVFFEQVTNAMKGVRELLEDPEHYATVVLGTDDSGKSTVNGYLRSPRKKTRLVISSLPEHIVEGFFNERTSIDARNDHSANLTYHVVVEINDEEDLQKITERLRDTKLKMIGLNNTAAGNANTVHNQDPDTLYLQMLIQVDYTYEEQRSNSGLPRFLEYILSFWNGVDLIYRQVENPKIRINIAGIIIAPDIYGTPFIWNNTLETDVSYDVYEVLYEATFYYYSIEKTSPIVDFDAVAVMTKMLGVDTASPNDTYNGHAFDIGTVCHRNDATMQNMAVMLVKENGAHSGIYTAAHEIGHLLGAFHEDEPNEHLNCTKVQEGTLMRTIGTEPVNRTRVSSCTLQDIRKLSKSGGLDCLYNVPAMTGTKLPGLMPGAISNVVEQCRAAGYEHTCLPNGTYVDVCTELWCTSTDDPADCVRLYDGAAPGTQCHTDSLTEYGVCLKNRCVRV